MLNDCIPRWKRHSSGDSLSHQSHKKYKQYFSYRSRRSYSYGMETEYCGDSITSSVSTVLRPVLVSGKWDKMTMCNLCNGKSRWKGMTLCPCSVLPLTPFKPPQSLTVYCLNSFTRVIPNLFWFKELFRSPFEVPAPLLENFFSRFRVNKTPESLDHLKMETFIFNPVLLST